MALTGHKVDVGGEGSTSINILDFIIKHSVTRKDPRHSQVKTMRNLLD